MLCPFFDETVANFRNYMSLSKFTVCLVFITWAYRFATSRLHIHRLKERAKNPAEPIISIQNSPDPLSTNPS